MELLTCKKLWSFCFCFILAISGWADDKEKFEKFVSKEFPISKNGKVNLVNKYGDVNVVTGNFKKVSIDVKITVNASSQTRADEVFERINIEFNNDSDYVSAVTTIGEAKRSWWSGGSSCGGDFQIHYDVQMPKSNGLALHNKYGNTYIGELAGATEVTVKYGALKMADVQNRLDLTIGYGNGTVGAVDDLNLEVKYSTLQFDEANDVQGITKYSKITINQASDVVLTTKYDNYDIGRIRSLRNEGKYDHFRIEEVADIDATSKYTDFKVGFLRDQADFDLEYGGALLSKIGNQFSGINVEGRYTDYKFKMEDGTKYHLDVESDYAGIRYPSAMQVVQHEEDGHEEAIQGYVGGGSDASLIKARLNYGSIKVED